MFGFNKRADRSYHADDGRAPIYKQVAVTPEAHAKLRQLAEKRNATIISTVDHLLGV